MKAIHITASEKQKSRLRNGHPVRCSPCAEGAGVSLLIHPERFDKVARVFRQGKGTTIALTDSELAANREVEGAGIFGKQFDRFVKKTIGKKATKELYKAAAKVGKPLVEKGLDAAALAATAYAPEAAPAIQAAKRAAKGYISRPSAYQANPTKELLKDVDPAKMVGDAVKDYVGSGLSRTRRKRNQKKFRDLAQTHILTDQGFVKAPLTPMGPLSGDILLEGGRMRPLMGGASRCMGGRMYTERSVSGRGSVGAFVPVAMRSDPYGANFSMNTQLPPDMVRGGVSFGSGLGAGLYL